MLTDADRSTTYTCLRSEDTEPLSMSCRKKNFQTFTFTFTHFLPITVTVTVTVDLFKYLERNKNLWLSSTQCLAFTTTFRAPPTLNHEECTQPTKVPLHAHAHAHAIFINSTTKTTAGFGSIHRLCHSSYNSSSVHAQKAPALHRSFSHVPHFTFTFTKFILSVLSILSYLQTARKQA
jgi:hypothetical protein